MRIAICDDCKDDIKHLTNLINKYSLLNALNVEIMQYECEESLFKDLKKDYFKIVFLDIYIDKSLGIDVAKKIREIDNNCLIIFTTISPNYALDAYSVHAIDYLLKPIDFDVFENALNRCVNFFSDSFKFIQVLSNRLMIKIPQKNIIFIEVFNKYCLIHTTDGVIKTYMSLSKLETLIDSNVFLRCHKSYMINMKHIEEILENDFLLKNNTKIPISQDKKLIFKQEYIDYLFKITRS